MKTLAELAGLVGGTLYGDGDKPIAGIAQVAACREDEITFALEEKFVQRALERNIGALLVKENIENAPVALIVVADPKMAAFQIAYSLLDHADPAPGISPLAFVDPSATVPDGCSVAPFASVGEGAQLGNGVVLAPGACVGRKAVVGDGSVIGANSLIGEGCVVGARCLFHPCVVIGADGFGFYPDETGKHNKIPQLGIADIGNDVEIGAGSCVDRATFGRTIVGDGTKIDNQVHIAHNCVIGKNCIIVAQTGLAGSVEVGDSVIFAARSASLGHVRVGDGAIVGAMAAVGGDIPDGARVGGVPARDHLAWKRSLVAVEKLPQTLKTIRRLEKRIEELEAKLTDKGVGK